MRIAVICGSGKGVWTERRRALGIMAPLHPEVVAIALNEAGVHHPDPLHHWASVHIDHLYQPPHEWAKRRSEGLLRTEYTRWGRSRGGNVDRLTKKWKGGSSGLFGVAVALDGLGLDAAILCGCPLDERENEFTGKPWGEYHRFRPSWTKWRHEFGGRTRSMSGWTQELLGRPTREWLRELTVMEAA